MAEDTLERLTGICLAMPGATRELKGQHAAFFSGKRTFAYFLNDHHGDGMVAVACKVLPGENASLIAAHPNRFYMPAYIGTQGLGRTQAGYATRGLEGSNGSGEGELRTGEEK